MRSSSNSTLSEHPTAQPQRQSQNSVGCANRKVYTRFGRLRPTSEGNCDSVSVRSELEKKAAAAKEMSL